VREVEGEAAEREQRVTPLELFFDLVFVFGITQVTTFLADDPTWGGLARGLLVLVALWWAWAAYAWLTNTLNPEEGAVRLVMFAVMAATLVASLAVPGAFGDDGVLFGVAYFAVRALHLVLYAVAGRGDRDLLAAVATVTPTAVIGPVLLVVAGFLEGGWQLSLWVVALTLDLLGGLFGRGRGWRVAPSHFAERHALVVIIAIGESIVAVGVGARGLELDVGEISAALLGIVVAAALWWSYFDWVSIVAERLVREAQGVARATLARDVYSYFHLPMVAGIVLFALGLKETLAHVGDDLGTIHAIGLCGGLALYFAGHVLVRFRVSRTVGHGRPVAVVVLVALIPVAVRVPALGALALVSAACVALIVYEALRYREHRAQIRSARITGDDFPLRPASTRVR
jgi:low temperature requirement protein LtrA